MRFQCNGWGAAGRQLSVFSCQRSGAASIEEELYVAFGAGDGGWDGFDGVPRQLSDGMDDFFDDEFVDFGIADDAAFADVSPPCFELRLD